MPDACDLSVVDRVVEEAGRTPDAVIPILQRLQAEFRELRIFVFDEDALFLDAEDLDLGDVG